MAEYCLVIYRGPNPETRFPLAKALITIGRDETNDIFIDDAEVSRFHARVILTERGGYELVDLDSMNGCFHNGQRVKQGMLSAGDRIGVGESVILSFEKLKK